MRGDLDATVELAPETVEYEAYDGSYELNTARFVLEPSVRALGWPVVRGRFTARRGHLVLGEAGELALELDAGSLRTNVFGLARTLTKEGGLCAADYPAIHFRSTDLLVLPDRSIEVVGRIEVLDAVRDVRLRGKLPYVDEDAVMVWVTGVLPPPRRQFEQGRWIAQVLGERPIHLELAAEFVR
ncbi:MAG TPA: YceI family protein [Amycolatopsis sp.]|nr:YceI family protein [Amycolatopsis sp.]